MSHCVSHGKDRVIFLTEEELKKPSSVVLPDDEEPRGLLLPNGEINWNCPCLGNMAVGPCSVEFRESISCFHKSSAEPKGRDCMEQFRAMNDCMSKYPSLYKSNDEEENKVHNLEEENKIHNLEEEESINSSKSIDNSNNAITSESNDLTKG